MSEHANPSVETPNLVDRLQAEDGLLPISLLSGPTAEEMMLSINLRHEWRGFSFGNFWFGYYFAMQDPSPPVDERWAV